MHAGHVNCQPLGQPEGCLCPTGMLTHPNQLPQRLAAARLTAEKVKEILRKEEDEFGGSIAPNDSISASVQSAVRKPTTISEDPGNLLHASG